MPAHLATSPLPSSLELMEQGLAELKETAKEEEEVEGSEAAGTPTPTNPSIIVPTLTIDNLPSEHTSSLSNIKLTPNLSFSSLQPMGGSPPIQSLKRIKSASNMATQTEMTATEVEDKAAKARTPFVGELVQKPKEKTVSEDSLLQPNCTSSTTQTTNLDLKTDSPSRLSVENITQTAHGASKTKRRKKRRIAIHSKKTNSGATAASRTSGSHLEVASVTSGSSAEFPEEGLFDLELSSDEEEALNKETSIILPNMGRTVSMPIIEERLARTEEWASNQYASAFHPFSDGDITPIVR